MTLQFDRMMLQSFVQRTIDLLHLFLFLLVTKGMLFPALVSEFESAIVVTYNHTVDLSSTRLLDLGTFRPCEL